MPTPDFAEDPFKEKNSGDQKRKKKNGGGVGSFGKHFVPYGWGTGENQLGGKMGPHKTARRFWWGVPPSDPEREKNVFKGKKGKKRKKNRGGEKIGFIFGKTNKKVGEKNS